MDKYSDAVEYDALSTAIWFMWKSDRPSFALYKLESKVIRRQVPDYKSHKYFTDFETVERIRLDLLYSSPDRSGFLQIIDRVRKLYEDQEKSKRERIIGRGEEKKVSVIVPCYNTARYLDKCMDQLIHQTIGIDNLEIILVDDASTDEGETAKLLQRYERRFPKTIKVIFFRKNLRQGGARNMGVSYAEGEYIAFRDADDWLLEETLEHVYQIAKDYDADMVSFARKYVNVRENPVSLEKGDRNRLFELDTLEKRKAFLLNMQEGASFTIPARLYAKRSFYLDKKLYICYLSLGSTMRSDDWENKKWDNLQVWMIMMEELQARGAFPLFQQKIEYLFFTQGIGWSL